MEIVPIGCTAINWEYFVKISEKYLGRSPTRPLDSNNLTVGDSESYLAALGEFRSSGTNPRTVLAFDSTVLKHFSITFLFVIPYWIYINLLEDADEIIFIPAQDEKTYNTITCIGTGTLLAWRNCLLNLNSSSDKRKFSYELYLTLLKLGFYNIFSNYKVLDESDGTKSLISR